MNERTVDIQATSFTEAVREAAAELGVRAADLAVELLDPGSSAESSGGYRPVKIRARVRPAGSAADGAHGFTGGRVAVGRDDAGQGWGRGGDGGLRGPHRRGRETQQFGPPPPPMDPAKITPELVAEVRSITVGLLESMQFPGNVEAERTQHGIRVAIDAGERDQYLIGRDGETLAAIQHLLGRMMRARMRDDAPPRIEVDVAGFRDRQIEQLRELARELMDEARQSGEEVTTDPLPASERRIVHLEVAESKDMETVTIGDGFYKRVMIRRAADKKP
jgi:predicted RNA-binding protein Jag